MGRIRRGRGREGKKKELLSLFFPREKIDRKKTTFFSLAKEKREGLQEKEKEKKLFTSPPSLLSSIRFPLLSLILSLCLSLLFSDFPRKKESCLARCPTTHPSPRRSERGRARGPPRPAATRCARACSGHGRRSGRSSGARSPAARARTSSCRLRPCLPRAWTRRSEEEAALAVTEAA